MKAFWLVFAAIVLITGVAIAATFRGTMSVGAGSDPAISYCQRNEEIARRERRAVEEAALTYMDAFERGPIEARALMSRVGRAGTTDRTALEAAAAQYHESEPSSARVATDAYVLYFSGGSQASVAVPCHLEGGRAAFVSRGVTWKTALVLLTEELPGDSERTITVWMEHERGAWGVRAVHFVPSRIAGLDAAQLWAAAREQRRARHAFNAYMLYGAARTAMSRGGFFQPSIEQDFRADLRTLEAPPEMRGQPPFVWEMGSKTFNVTLVEYRGFDNGDVGLIINHVSGSWESPAEAEALNHALIDAFNAAYPEWREVFDAVAARAARPGENETWGTVYLKEGGYTQPPVE